MDSDKFDRVVFQLLYGELDELTTRAAHRHMAQSTTAREVFAQYQATRQLSRLPRHAPATNLTEQVLARAAKSVVEVPLPVRTGRVISTLAGYAMRPQVAMGTLLLLMIGSSLVLLRARPGQHGPVQVTERGAPELDSPRVVPIPARRDQAGVLSSSRTTSPAPRKGSPHTSRSNSARPKGSKASRSSRTNSKKHATPSPSRTTFSALPLERNKSRSKALPPQGLSPFEQALEVYRAGRYVEAKRRFETLVRKDAKVAGRAALYAARSVRMSSGCGPAVSHLEKVRTRYPGSRPGHEATWRSAQCLTQTGNVAAAKRNYESLLRIREYSSRAKKALARL